MDLIRKFIRDLQESAESSESTPQSMRDGSYGLRAMENFSPPWPTRPMIDVPEARAIIEGRLQTYARNPAPDYMLLFPMAAGIGKTWQAVKFAHWLSSVLYGKRVFFAGQRTAAFEDIRAASVGLGENPDDWMQWLPRATLPDQDDPKSTCLYHPQISEFMGRGYKGDEFCEAICARRFGWDFLTNGCKYHLQKGKPQPIIFGQHAHLTLGHPLMSKCFAMIGDENPMNSFPRTWSIPAKELYSLERISWEDERSILFYEGEPFMKMLYGLRGIIEDGGVDLSGPALISALAATVRSPLDGDLSDAALVNRICTEFSVPADRIMTPNVKSPEEAFNVDYNFLPDLVPLLARESEWAMSGERYIERLRAYNGRLEMTLRNWVNEQVPAHVVWFDATGDKSFYEALFRRKVEVVDAMPAFKGRIWQVHDRLNGKGSIIVDGDSMATPEFEAMAEEGKEVLTEEQQNIETTRQLEDAAVIFKVLARKHASLSVISFKALTGTLGGDYEFMHFYANRGSNQLEGTDALVVFGTPMPSLPAMIDVAKAIYFEEMRPFDFRWRSVERAYRVQNDNGDWLGNTVREFMDDRLNVILWQSREAELIQSVHRARPIINDCDVYLFSSIPIDQLAPTKLVSMFELLGDDEPQGMSPVTWARIKLAVEEIYEEDGAVTATALAEKAGVSRSAAFSAFNALLEGTQWEEAIVPVARGGRGKRTARALTRKE